MRGRLVGGAGLVVLSLYMRAVAALFLTLPYGKCAHAAYRAASLPKWAIERRKPGTLRLGDD